MSRRKQKIFAVLLGLLALAVAAFGVFLAVAGRSRDTVLLTEPADPRLTAELFLNSLCEGDYETACSLIRGQPDLGLDALPELQPARELAEAFRQSWSWEPAAELWQKDSDARFPILFTSLNLYSLTDGLDEAVLARLSARLESAQRREELYNEDDTWREEAVQSAAEEELLSRLEDTGPYLHATRLTLTLRYEDSRWVIVPSELLYQLLAGEVRP